MRKQFEAGRPKRRPFVSRRCVAENDVKRRLDEVDENGVFSPSEILICKSAASPKSLFKMRSLMPLLTLDWTNRSAPFSLNRRTLSGSLSRTDRSSTTFFSFFFANCRVVKRTIFTRKPSTLPFDEPLTVRSLKFVGEVKYKKTVGPDA